MGMTKRKQVNDEKKMSFRAIAGIQNLIVGECFLEDNFLQFIIFVKSL